VVTAQGIESFWPEVEIKFTVCGHGRIITHNTSPVWPVELFNISGIMTELGKILFR
jgi:hypothetical protein